MVTCHIFISNELISFHFKLIRFWQSLYLLFQGADVAPLTNVGVPGAGLVVEAYDDCGNLVPSKYFYYHHTEADTMDKISLYDFQQCVGAAASVLYVLADMEGTLPTEPDIPDRLFSF